MAFGVTWAMACDRDVPVQDTDRPELRIVATSPEALDTGYPLERAMRLRFDRYLNPASVVRQSVLVTPAMLDAETGAPKGPVVFFEPVYDPYDRLAVFHLASGARWTPTTLHTVKLLAPLDASDVTGFRAFDGAPLPASETFSFTTGDAVTDPDIDVDDVRPRVRFCDEDEVPGPLPSALSVMRKGCAVGGCHGQGAVLGLDMSGPDAIRGTAVRVVAKQTMTGASVSAPASNPRRFGDDMPRLDPGNPGNSYVIYKLLVNPNNHPATAETLDEPDPWFGELPPPGPPSHQEISRLRSWFVHGEPMPLGGQLHPDEMRSLVRWVLGGAQTPACAH